MAEFKRVVNVIPLTRVATAGPQVFSYIVPLELEGLVRTGQLVRIPFGPRQISGLVNTPEMPRLAGEVKKYKSIESLGSPQAVIGQKSLALANWLSEYYAAPLGLVVKAMLPALAKKSQESVLEKFSKHNPDYVLTEHQRLAVTQISGSLGKSDVFVVHGVTGSGKTEVYMQVIKRVVERGKQVIMLVPEISLTPQAIERFSERFGAQMIAVLHSRLKSSEKVWMLERIRSREKLIIIGPRSAIFAPVQDLGLVVVDEEHDLSYKQFDQQPKYHARTVAKKLCQLWECPLVLGDATPSVETFYETAARRAKLLPLPYRIRADAGMPQIKVVNMRREAAAGNKSLFSEQLKFHIIETLRARKQIILFLNRRGNASFVLCRDCGYALSCTRCSVSLVWHSSSRKLMCHHCGKVYRMPEKCPACQGVNLINLGIGTQAVEEELNKFLKKEYPETVSIERMDRDTTTDASAHETIYKQWKNGDIKILIGTQMITKGWDIAAVGLVGIVSADSALNLPDFRTNERVFQILVQVAGRTGRGKDPGLVILQSYNPENPAIQAARHHDYQAFYTAEIKARREFSYPPFTKLVKLRISHKEQKTAEANAVKTRTLLEGIPAFPGEILGPIPAFIFKLRGNYQYQIFLKIPNERPVNLYELLKDLPSFVDIDVDPESLL